MKTGPCDLSLPAFGIAFLLLSIVFCLPIQSIAEEIPTQATRSQNALPARSWQVGVYAQGGFPPAYEVRVPAIQLKYGLDLKFLSAGAEAGKQTRRFDGPRLVRGRCSAMLAVEPPWIARYPPQTVKVHLGSSGVTQIDLKHFNGQTFHGVSVTPLLLRWNFSQRDSARVVPWVQLGGGLLWTNH